ncbi:hypothetical protein JX265_012738 [Neoarthrinium moseri]|uniref:Uncharacterized protein n=1 Tax=Neoarthrinium moseri TaxID=1658444 RepID=A0A9P9W9P2_9PEZI|nr:hypothetical protein JX265_012738 [Neoarthrinium moseri]
MDAMDLDMDVDVDLVPDEPINAQPQDTPSPGEVVDAPPPDQPESTSLVPNKVHIRGLDQMNPNDIKAYAAEHYPNSAFERIEWIDDSSANLIYPSESVAQEALVGFSSVEIADVSLLPALELLPAKAFSQKPTVVLQVRVAVVADKKQPKAAERSRFYLLNPEFDPENRKRYRDRRDGGGDRRRRDGYSRMDEPVDEFDVNLYDDDTSASATRKGDSHPRPRRRRSFTPDYDSDDRRSRSYRSANRNKELFPGGTSGRGRSASPARDRDGDHGMGETPPSEGSAERNRRGGRAIKDRLTRPNRSKELFPDNAASSESNRLDDADELTKKFALPVFDGSHDEKPLPRGRRLEDRVSTPSGRLADRITDPSSSGFSIRGTAGQRSADQGFAIKGGAKTAKELFPDKLGPNTGKELFADKSDGRSRRRQKAGDLFD